jgi:hypothetical protein
MKLDLNTIIAEAAKKAAASPPKKKAAAKKSQKKADATAEKPKRKRKGQETKSKDDTTLGTPADAPKEAPLVSPEPAAEKPKRKRKGQGTKPTAAADAGTPAEAPKEAPLVSPADTSASSERPPRTPEQQARRDAWLASQGQQSAAGNDQDKQQPAAAQSPEEKQAAVDKRLKRMFGIERTKRSIGDRLKGAWRGFTADAGEDLGKASGGYRSVFHEVQRLMEQYRLIGRILHEQSLYEGLAGQQGKLDVAPPFGQLTAADFAKLRRRQKHIKEALAMQIVREQLYTHHTTLAELNINQRNALMELVKSRCDEMFCRLDETDADDSGEEPKENPYAYLDDEYDAPPAPKGGHVNMRMATLKLVDRARNAHRRRREELGEANLSPSDAKNILDTHDAHDDFHALKKDKVEALLAAAKNAKYRKGKNAPGSTGRMFHQHLTRLARKA